MIGRLQPSQDGWAMYRGDGWRELKRKRGR
jgi:hypothetical protein